MGLVAAETGDRSQDTEALYRAHGTAVANLCRSLLRDRGDAEDATQQVFLSAHRALLNGVVPREPLTWLLAVARNECYARFRQRAAIPVPTEQLPEKTTADASAQALRAGEMASVWDEVEQMPSAQREAFLLREIRGLSYGQLADELALSPPSVRSLLLRARTRLRERLRDVAALGGTPWLQGAFRLLGGGEGASPVPAATKVAAVGFGALALVGGGDGSHLAHRSSTLPARATVRHLAVRPAPHASAPQTFVTAPSEDRSRGSESHTSGLRSDSGSGRDGAGDSSGSGSGGDGSGDTSSTQVVQTDGHDGGTSGSDGSSSSTSTSSATGSTLDGGSDSTTTVTTSGSSDGSGSDSGSTSNGGTGSSGTDGSTSTTPDG